VTSFQSISAAADLTDAQASTLTYCRGKGLSDYVAKSLLVPNDMLKILKSRGLIKYRSYAQTPHWVITSAGRNALAGHKQS
jgi:hypothetical protein